MPKFTFICSKCSNSSQRIVPASRTTFPCDKCQHEMDRQMPILSGATQVNETIDPLTNAVWKKDQEEILRARQEDYFWSVEVPRLVQTYSVETCLEQGWMYLDDDGKPHIQTKPPSKR